MTSPNPYDPCDDSIFTYTNLPYKSTFNYINLCSPPPQDLCFDIAVRQVRQTQQKHVRAIFSVENNAVMVRHRQELYLSRDG